MSDISTYTEYGQLGTMEAEKVGNLVTAAESGGGGGSMYNVEFRRAYSGGTYSDYEFTDSDVTYEDLKAALSAGKPVAFKATALTNHPGSGQPDDMNVFFL